VVVGVLLGSAVLFLCGVLTGWALAYKASLPLERAYSSAPPAAASAAVFAQAVADKASKAEVRAIGSEVESQARRIEQLTERLESRPEPEPTTSPAPLPDLGPLRARVDALAKASERLAPLPEGLKATDERVAAMVKELEALRADVGSLRQEVERAGSAAAKSGAVAAADHALSLSAVLFKGGNYARARDVLLKQAEATPDDARLWYSAALANGLATGDWRGETEQLVKQGVEREQAGTPPRVEIDALFAGIGDPQGGRWLREWRQKAAGR
jgi:hypothetical protein